MTPFFVPGLADEVRAAEAAYGNMRQEVARHLGRPPRSCRILELWTRRGNVDCVTTVGAPDPISGELVMAIFDMGSHQPFVVWRQARAGKHEAPYEVLGCNAYSVLEFEP